MVNMVHLSRLDMVIHNNNKHSNFLETKKKLMIQNTKIIENIMEKVFLSKRNPHFQPKTAITEVCSFKPKQQN